MDRVQKKRIVTVKFSNAVFSLSSTHDDLSMQALVWLHMVQFRVIQFGAVLFCVSYANLR